MPATHPSAQRRPGHLLFITGMQRSGTTLLERMIAGHPQASILSQPFPLLYVEAKRDFLSGLGRAASRYPLGHLFGECGYRQSDFDGHLARLEFGAARLADVFEQMRGYSGQYTRFDAVALRSALAQAGPAGFARLTERLHDALCPGPGAIVKGSKETICEEFLPHLLDSGWRCVVIVRDPRDVVASLNHGRGQEFGGKLKPTLFNVRNWRKSVAYALQLERRERFSYLRYEDLVADPLGSIRNLLESLGLAAVRDADLGGWSGNSSHGERSGVSTESVGAHRRVLPAEVARFVEATCLPEMRTLGYATGMGLAEARRVIGGFEEPYDLTREGVVDDLAGAGNAALEIERLDRLDQSPGPESRAWFLSEATHERLRDESHSGRAGPGER